MKHLYLTIQRVGLVFSGAIILVSCREPAPSTPIEVPVAEQRDVLSEASGSTDTVLVNPTIIPDPSFDPRSLVAFAKTQLGVPYLYASVDPTKGFDCSGFVTYVFTHFGVSVPRSSVDFTNYGKPVDTTEAGPGDLILFTGTDSSDRTVGHMGIIERIENGTIYFIHSTSGKAKGVVITPLENYYRKRFVKVVRVFPDRYFE